MPKIYPKKHQIVSSNLADGENVGIFRINIVSSTDVVELGAVASDVAFLHTSKATSDPTFYLTDNDTKLNIDGATVGTEYVVVSRHRNFTNYAAGNNLDPNRPK